MKLTIAAIGRMKSGADSALVERYSKRIQQAGRAVGLGPLTLVELAESRAGNSHQRKDDEAIHLLKAAPSQAANIVLHETGKSMSSRAFATHLARLRDDGTAHCCFFIGGADGHGETVLRQADLVLSLGAMTYPHQLVRVLLTEQIYRAITILTGHPYHRD